MRVDTQNSHHHGNITAKDLRARSLKVTKNRLTIIKALALCDKGFSAKTVFQEITDTLAEDVDFSTVFRFLHILEEKGLIHQNKAGHFVICRKPEEQRGIHVIMTCEACDQAFEEALPLETEEALHLLMERRGFQSKLGVLNVVGYCSGCTSC